MTVQNPQLSKSPTPVVESEGNISHRNSTTQSEENTSSNRNGQDDVNTNGNVNTQAKTLFLNAATPEGNESRPIVISICNPLTEDARIRQHCPSEIFCVDPNPVQMPSWVKDSKCKPLLIDHLI